MAEGKPGFWSTLPGILTGLAALVASMTGLYAVFNRPPAAPAAPHAEPPQTAGLSEMPAAQTADARHAATHPRQVAAGDGEVRATVVDPDGSTNVRAGPSSESAVVAKISEGEIFWTRPRDGHWWHARTADGQVGYVHRSRIRLNP